MKVSFDDVQTDVLIMQAAGGYNEALALDIFRDLKKQIDGGLKKIIYDCSNVEFISSLDLGLLARIRSRVVMNHGDVKLCCVKGMVKDVLEMTHMDTLFDIQPDLDSALKAFATS